ncbi:ROK family protein [Spiroplasma endosymbiont of Labia minor]|uniref:ROK family protein n=1 Tax=Spiroplasma endosymbiont of Labia minor TaxID=3066305 RepID=UPI003BAFCABD
MSTFIENDANCAAIAELISGNAKFCSNGFLFIMGTGIGGAVIINNKLYKGINFAPGDFGYSINNIEKYQLKISRQLLECIRLNKNILI